MDSSLRALAVVCAEMLALLAALPAGYATAQEKPPPYRDEQMGLVFADIDGLDRLDVYHFEQKELGYSVDYETPQDMRVSIYVYDLGIDGIADGAFSETVKQQLEQAKGDIRRAREQGRYQAAEEVQADVVVLGETDTAPKMRHARFKLRRDDRDWISHIYLTGHRQKFVKVRCSFPAEHEVASEKLLARVLSQLSANMAASPKMKETP
jgi:hypothetical protein